MQERHSGAWGWLWPSRYQTTSFQPPLRWVQLLLSRRAADGLCAIFLFREF